MTNERLPPLTALRAFEAAARHMSFSRAAAELKVTPAALSFQIKSLEEYLSAPVFRRMNRCVELTDAGKALAPGCTQGFAELGRAWMATRRVLQSNTLTVTAGPAFVGKWLAPRLFDFTKTHPDIDLRLTANRRLMDFERDDVDVAIRFGSTIDEDGMFSRVLIREWVSPMVSPELAETLQSPKDLAGMNLLRDDTMASLDPSVLWKAWLNAANSPEIAHPAPRLTNVGQAIDAALNGAGAVLGRVSLTSQALRDGHLVMPFPIALNTRATYNILCPHEAVSRPLVASFIEWIEAQAANSVYAPEGLEFVSLDDSAA